MVPRISVRRQVRFGRPVAIERLRGRQYRCLRCNLVFYELDELDHHILQERPGPDSQDVPRFEEPVLLRIFYSRDVREGWGETLRERRARPRR
jgi:hypothetical protein